MRKKVVAISMIISLLMGFSITVSAATYLWPVPGVRYISQYYGNGHKGIDIAANGDHQIVAAREGTVIAAASKSCTHNSNLGDNCNYGMGNYVQIKHSDGSYATYMHMRYGSITVSVGQKVSRGTKIGMMGSSGNSSGQHLHFQVGYSSSNTINVNPDSLGYDYNNTPTPTPTEQPVNFGDNFYAAIFHVDSGKAITYDNDGPVGYVCLRRELGSAKQVWRFVRQSDGSYVIASTINNKLLEMTAGDTTNGVQASVGSEDWGGYYQRWYIYACDNGYIIKSKHFSDLNRVLDVAEGNTNEGAPIVTWYRQNTRNQIFNIYKGGEMMMTNPQLSVKTENAVTTLSWGDIYGEATYFVHIYKDGALYSEKVIPTGEGCSYSQKLPDGNYTAYVAAHNAFYAKDSNTVRFSVLNGEKAPDTWIKANQSIYYVGDDVVFDFGYKYTTSVSLGIDKDGKRYANPEVTGKGSYTYRLTEPGTYSVYVSGWSQDGYEDSKRISFTVYQKLSDVDLDSNVIIDNRNYQLNSQFANTTTPAVYAAASYTADGRLLDIRTAELASGAQSARATLPKADGAKYIKVFLWNSAEAMNPLAECETIVVN